jgi:hypothetical protein
VRREKCAVPDESVDTVVSGVQLSIEIENMNPKAKQYLENWNLVI